MARLLLAVLVLVGVTPVAGQESRFAPGPRPGPGWLGVSYDVQWLQQGDRCEPRVLVERVLHGSPAERAGLRPGDVILTLNGQPAPGARLVELARRLAPGDSVRLRFRRDGRTRDVTAVADRRPTQPVAETVRIRSGLDASTAPVVRLEGDTLVARNVEGLLQGARGYWLTDDDGETRYRRLARWSDDDLDARVLRLLRCAATVDWDPLPTRPAVDVARVRQRADSLRVVIAQRALSGGGEQRLEIRTLAREDEPARAGVAQSWVMRTGDGSDLQVFGSGPYVLRLEDHLTAAMRGVAGAELTAIEPELAEYFRNVRSGLLVLRTAPGTPADRAGLRPGDVIVEAQARRIDSVDELRSLLARPGPGPVELRVVRKGRVRELRIRR
jgi:membrane-associated protease RseP (regulator of RpoE activity)